MGYAPPSLLAQLSSKAEWELGGGGRHTGLRCALSLVDLSAQADLPGTP